MQIQKLTWIAPRAKRSALSTQCPSHHTSGLTIGVTQDSDPVGGRPGGICLASEEEIIKQDGASNAFVPALHARPTNTCGQSHRDGARLH